MAKVSIIVPVYKVEAYLEKCVSSIVKQTLQEIEIILVDDGSPDRCPAICDQLAKTDSRIRVIHQENKGLGGARNTGILAATSPYLLFVDSDDTIHESLAEKTYRAAQQQDADIILFDLISVDKNGCELWTHPSPVPKGQPLTLRSTPKLLMGMLSACNRLFRRALFIENEIFFPDHLWYEDLHTVPKLLLCAQKVFYLDEPPLYYYFIRTNSIMHSTNAERTAKERSEAVEDVLQYYRARGQFEAYRNEMEWLAIYHGFFLPSREITHFFPDFPRYTRELKKKWEWVLHKPQQNPYYSLLSKKERLVFYLFYREHFHLIRILEKIYQLQKKW